MADDGWIKVYRQIWENPLYFAERFTKIQAWIDLLLLANHKPNTFYIRGNAVNLERGQTGRSILTLAERWKWNQRTVKAFLNQLQKEEMIQYRTNHITTVITILKYETYQSNAEQTTKQNAEQSKNRMHTNKNDKNEKNDKNIYEGFENLNNEPFINAYSEWIGFRKELKKALKPTTITKQLEFLNKQPDPIKCINQSIQNGWQGLFEVKNGTQPEAGNINRTNGLPPVLGKKYKTADLSNS